MYKFLATKRILAAIKPEENYEWFTYQGSKPVITEFRGKPVEIKKGQRFGVRKSSNGKQIRMILPRDPNRVITLTLDQAQRLAKKVSS